MTRTVFRASFLLGVIVLLLCALLFFAVQYRQTLDETYLALQQEAVYAAHGLEMSGQTYLETLGEINRITWIADSGEVLYDSEFELPLANQMQYAEVSSAASSGEGQGIRRSGSSGTQTMYYALRCDDGSILRLSRPLSAVQYALIAVSPVFWIILLVLMISALLSFRTAHRIVKPINEIDLDTLNESPYPELTPLVLRIREQKQTILDKSSEQERLRREFSANVSHELKTPLTSISGFAELMARGDVPEGMVREFSSDIYHESQRMIILVNDIIRLSRLDEGTVELVPEAVDLYALAGDTLDSLRSSAENANVTLRLSGDSVVIRGIWQLLYEAIFNACDNAIKYNRPGGTVTVEVRQDPDGQARLSVIDTGIGIPKEHQNRVFERFYRVDKSHSKSIGGTGLGLSIVKHVAQYYNAKLQLESEENAGTSITLIFPQECVI